MRDSCKFRCPGDGPVRIGEEVAEEQNLQPGEVQLRAAEDVGRNGENAARTHRESNQAEISSFEVWGLHVKGFKTVYYWTIHVQKLIHVAESNSAVSFLKKQARYHNNTKETLFIHATVLL